MSYYVTFRVSVDCGASFLRWQDSSIPLGRSENGNAAECLDEALNVIHGQLKREPVSIRNTRQELGPTLYEITTQPIERCCPYTCEEGRHERGVG